ncbi:DMT family transporter [Nonomuraea sp. NPDC050310]|uniref:DMT family transporter n=1 Tax=Nonomuraea sp. NPDC050310 TaxID=3154935 RepID=UPI0033D2CE5B
MLLLFVSAAWGSAFPLMDSLIARLPVTDLLTERYSIAALTLFLIRPGSLRGLSRETWIQGAILGLVFGIGQSAQAWGLSGLTSSVSGFAVGCNVVITPLLGLIVFRSRVPRRIWVAVALAVTSMTLFTLVGGSDGTLDAVALSATLGAAGLYSVHTLMLGSMSRKRFDAYAVTVIQLGVIGLVTGGVAIPDGLQLPQQPGDWLILVHLSVISCALGFLARSYGQRHVSAVPAAVLMSSQPLWAAGLSVAFFGERLHWTLLVGGGLTAVAMLLAVPPRQRRRPPRPGDPNVLAVSRKAKRVLADLRRRREDPLRLGKDARAPFVALTTCENAEGCPWRGMSVKGGREPSLDRLIVRASALARESAEAAQGEASASGKGGCCRSVTVSGRCLCRLLEDAERDRAPRVAWLRTSG